MIRGRLKPNFQFQTTFYRISNLSLPPSHEGRLGWGWLCGFRQNQIRAAHRATLSPALSRQTGEGAGCMSWHRFLSGYRHSRAGGNLLLNLGNCFQTSASYNFQWIPACAGMTAMGCFFSLFIRKGRLKLSLRFQTTSFIQSTQAWSNSSSVGFAHE